MDSVKVQNTRRQLHQFGFDVGEHLGTGCSAEAFLDANDGDIVLKLTRSFKDAAFSAWTLTRYRVPYSVNRVYQVYMLEDWVGNFQDPYFLIKTEFLEEAVDHDGKQRSIAFKLELSKDGAMPKEIKGEFANLWRWTKSHKIYIADCHLGNFGFRGLQLVYRDWSECVFPAAMMDIGKKRAKHIRRIT